MTTTGLTTGRYCDRQDAEHILSTLPPLGGIERSHATLAAAVAAWRPTTANGEQSGGLVLTGPTGSGKTTAARHLALRLLSRLEHATSMLWVLASQLADDPTMTERARRVRYLILDDLGQERDPQNRIFQVLDHRHTRWPTIVTTGLSARDLDAHYDPAFIRRLMEFRGSRVTVASAFGDSQPVSRAATAGKFG